ncbi:MAG: hypothetical protein V4488_07240 [Pseudomonadota bacterium]
MDEHDLRAHHLISDIANTFPDVGEKMRRTVDELDLDGFQPTFMLEAFATATTNAFVNGDDKTARQHLEFIENRIDPTDNYIFELIDGFYVGNLMIGISKALHVVGMRLMPLNIQLMYERLHGSRLQ